jgi:hypothetical protein
MYKYKLKRDMLYVILMQNMFPVIVSLSYIGVIYRDTLYIILTQNIYY